MFLRGVARSVSGVGAALRATARAPSGPAHWLRRPLRARGCALRRSLIMTWAATPPPTSTCMLRRDAQRRMPSAIAPRGARGRIVRASRTGCTASMISAGESAIVPDAVFDDVELRRQRGEVLRVAAGPSGAGAPRLFRRLDRRAPVYERIMTGSRTDPDDPRIPAAACRIRPLPDRRPCGVGQSRLGAA